MLCCCSDHANLLKETLEKQFEVVKERVSRNGTYMQGSHVLQFGSLSIDEEPAGDYLGEENTGKPYYAKCALTQRLTQRLTASLAHTKAPQPCMSALFTLVMLVWCPFEHHPIFCTGCHFSFGLVLVCLLSFSKTTNEDAIVILLSCVGDGTLNGVVEDSGYSDSLLQREAELLPLYLAVERASNGPQAHQASAALQQALDVRFFVDEAIKQAVSLLLAQPQVMNLVQVSMQSAAQHTLSAAC